MYLEWIRLRNFRSFRDVKIDLIHPDRNFKSMKLPKPRYPNINLLLGNNGSGKSALLKGVALSALGPAAGDAGIFPYRLVRREPSERSTGTAKSNGVKEGGLPNAELKGRFKPHPQDRVPANIEAFESLLELQAVGDIEKIQWTQPDAKLWHPIYRSASDAFFFVGYGAARRVERKERTDLAARRASAFVRAQRVLGLFEDSYPLVPLTAWLPAMSASDKGRFTQVRGLINELLAGQYTFSGQMESGEYLFSRGGLAVPFPALSDGYRAFLGWVGDLLYHVAVTCPKGHKLKENRGIVMVDEIDLHLHPKWQMTVLPELARALPNLQFIVTSHSPLLVGSLEWMNIVVMEAGAGESSVARRIPAPVHGLDADQVLLTDFFGMQSTRAQGKERKLKTLTLRARGGDMAAAKEIMKQMTRGEERPA